MADLVDISTRGHEGAHSALMDTVSRYKAMGASDKQIGQVLIASALPYLWETDSLDDLKRAASDTLSEEVDNFSQSIGYAP